MSSNEDIETLIEKFYLGETSLAEEKQLQTFFQGEDIPSHLKSYQAQFQFLHVSSKIKWEAFSEEKLFGKLESPPSEKKTPKTVRMLFGENQVWLYRTAAAVALILVGYFVGNSFKSNNEVSELRAELKQVKSLMMGQFESGSASGRLQAVNSSFEFSEADDQILEALIVRANEDQNANVRLKAIEALARFGNQTLVKTALVNALGKEKEPTVQISLINTLVALKEKDAINSMQGLLDNDETLAFVKDEAHLGIFKLKSL